MNQRRKSITFDNGQCTHFSWNPKAYGVNMRIIPLIPTPNLLSFQIFPTPPIIPTPPFVKFSMIFQPPHLFQPPNYSVLSRTVTCCLKCTLLSTSSVMAYVFHFSIDMHLQRVYHQCETFVRLQRHEAAITQFPHYFYLIVVPLDKWRVPRVVPGPWTD